MTPRKKLAADAWGSLLRVHAALVPTLDRAVLSETGLPLTWYDVLLELVSAPDGQLRMSDLADRVVLSRTRVSRLVEELVGRGLVAKRDHPDDRRSALAAVTEKGRAEFAAAAPVYLRAIETQFAAGLTNHDLGELGRLLKAILERA